MRGETEKISMLKVHTVCERLQKLETIIIKIMRQIQMNKKLHFL